MTSADNLENGTSSNTIEDLVTEFLGEPDSLAPEAMPAIQGTGSPDPVAAVADPIDPHIEQIIQGYAPRSEPRPSSAVATRAQTLQDLEQLGTLLQRRDLGEDPEISPTLKRLQSFLRSGVEQEVKSRQQRLRQVISQLIRGMSEAKSQEQLLAVLVQELQRILKADRVVICQHQEDGETATVIAEALTRGYTPMVNQSLPLLTFGVPEAQMLLRQPVVALSSRRNVKLMPYQQQLFERYQIDATLALPLFEGEQIWGLLAVQQCSRPRIWQDLEVELLSRALGELSRFRQQANFVRQIRQAHERERAISRIIDRIRQSVDIQEIYRTTTQELRQLLNCDRVGIYQFNPDWSGQFVAESVAPGWVSLIQEQQTNLALLENISECSAKDLAKGANQSLLQGRTAQTDTYLQRTQGGMYSQGTLYRITPDIYTGGFSRCYLEILETYQARAYVIVAIYQGNTLWGLLAAYQNSGPRQWQESEISVLLQVAPQMGIAQQQAEYLQQLMEAREREQAITKIIGRIRQSLDITRIFKSATQELRTVLRCDRVGIYQFNPDWSGQFVAESVGAGWVRLLEEQQDNPDLLENISECSVKDLGGGRGPASADTYLQQTQGGAYSRGQIYRVTPDIYQAGFTPCYLQILEAYQARAYMIVAIYQGESLWGLLAAYQNSGPRQWQQSEINVLMQVAPQLGIALQQAEYVRQVQQQSQQLAEAAQREKRAKESLQQQVLQLLLAVQPALEGDLTVRAQVTEDEVGTIAGLYNNTLQSLSQLVIQVKASANQVSQTSQHSQEAISELSQQARQQLQALGQAIQEIQIMAQSSEQVVSRVAQVETAVQAANQTVHQGDQAMNSTVEGILAVQSTVAEAQDKIARLQDASEKISKVIGLISSFATQTNLLALNAAIEASRAGEYGRGFGVVADEVRSLARQSAAATTEIERLVQEIQVETQTVAEAMERGMHQVREGTDRVTLTRQSLTAIVTATDQISELVHAILESTQAQEHQAHAVTQRIEAVAQIAQGTDAGAQGLTQALQALLTTAQSLQTSVDEFKVQ